MLTYIQESVEERELRALVKLAEEEEREFFSRNPHLVKPYRNRLIAIALCQGAALQYLRCGYGVKDFDVHFFYAQNPAKPRLSGAVKRISTNVGRFHSVPVDFIRTVIPTTAIPERSIEARIRRFLEGGASENATRLSEKAVIGLLPTRIFGKALWRPPLPRAGEPFRRGEVVKLVRVHYGQGEFAGPDSNELLLRDHVGQMCQVVEVADTSIQLILNSGDRV